MTPRKAALIARLGEWVVRAVIATLRVRIEDRAGVLAPDAAPVIWIFWHNRLFIVPDFYRRALGERPGAALTSASKDGEIVAAFLARFRIQAVRGSSSRRGVAALIELIRLARDGYHIGITPDGPRGPRYTLNPGVITLAQKTGAAICPIRVHYSRFWQLKSWDGFMIPKPFSSVEIVLQPLENVAATDGEAGFESERARIESVLRADQS
ncbi:MAG: lysophospholipid acyltransferase family protein [Chthoniobacteraceae bacterium]